MNPELRTRNSTVEQSDSESGPPFFKTWGKLYGLVIAELALLVALFYLFTRVFE